MIYFFNPFKDILESPTPFSNPPVVWFPNGNAYQVLFVWDIDSLLKSKSSPAAHAELVEDGVSRRGKIRAQDGTEYFCSLWTPHDPKCELKLTGFRGPAFNTTTQPTKETDMTILRAIQAQVVLYYREGEDDGDNDSLDVEAELAKCNTLAETRNYLQWDDPTWEDFLAREVAE